MNRTQTNIENITLKYIHGQT